jgi:hypothetical protein
MSAAQALTGIYWALVVLVFEVGALLGGLLVAMVRRVLRGER